MKLHIVIKPFDITIAGTGVVGGIAAGIWPGSGTDRVAMIGAVVGLVSVLMQLKYLLKRKNQKIVIELLIGSPRIGPRLTRGTASLAARLAGGRRSYGAAFQADLDGHPDSGRVLSPKAQRRHAIGLLKAALKMRLHDLTRPCWTPVDWILRSNSRTNTFITAAVGALVIYIQVTSGLHTLLVEGLHSCAIVGAGLYGLSRWLRKIRGIQPLEADPKGQADK
ncbi:hypothetical protein OHA84_25570 [Streptomyces sp. NBC_00513]|uniref:hypothetical protein n=1 Tax=unclassified Streptomyces TaxID=2593676 RepID=UPI002253C5D2|nr:MULTISPECIES: hypothetical protein [unclassified Streptomyces]MCX5073113.1 hypothetical protein [Streptomyces sp. NBC_00424]MCX5155358.1 hypothetical protein [Streptomyces sp. NBC_00291]WUD43603.1 hypothetical protein OHA84_25570 [Streptomyces sp. NBC_00513]